MSGIVVQGTKVQKDTGLNENAAITQSIADNIESKNILEDESIQVTQQVAEIKYHLDKLCKILRDIKDRDLKLETDEHIQFLKEKLGDRDLCSDKVLQAIRVGLSGCMETLWTGQAKEYLQFIEENFNFNKQELFSKIILPAAQGAMSKNLDIALLGNTKKIIQFVKNYNRSFNKENLFSDEVLKHAHDVIAIELDKSIRYFSKGLINFLKENIKEEDLLLKVILPAAQEGLRRSLNNENFDIAKDVVRFVRKNFRVSQQELFLKVILPGAEAKLSDALRDGSVDEANKIVKFVKINSGVSIQALFSEKVLSDIRKGLSNCLRDSMIFGEEKFIQFVKDNFKFNKQAIFSEVILPAARERLVSCLKRGNVNGANKVIKFLEEKNKDLFNREDLLSEDVLQIALSSLSDFISSDYLGISEDIFEFIKSEFGNRVKITEDHLNLVKEKKFIDLYSIQKALEDGVDTNNIGIVFDYLIRYGEEWKDPQISESFKKGVELFGRDLMLEYINDKRCNLHDKMMCFKEVCEICKKFCTNQDGILDKKKIRNFYFNILEQVKKDGSIYYEGFSYHHFNSIVRDLKNTDITTILEKAEALKEKLPELDKLLVFFNDSSNIVASWKDLKKFLKLKALVDMDEIGNELVKIKDSNKKLYNYIEPFFFYTDSSPDRKALHDLLFEPEMLFKRDDANSKIESIRLSNCYKYGLSAEDLREAIVNGVLDRLQEVRPMEIEYTVRKRSTIEYLREAIGQYKRFPGRASEPTYLYETVGKLLEGINEQPNENGKTQSARVTYTNLRQVFRGERELSKEEEEKILELLMIDSNMRKIIDNETDIYRVQIHRKSDPMATLVGDDTACCMPFGSAKGNIYFFTPNNAILSVQKKLDNGEFRTIAQSVVTLDIDTGKTEISLPGDIDKIPSESFHKKVLTCDNVEVAPNYKNEEYIPIIQDLYKLFFRSYLDEFTESMRVDDTRVIIGEGFTAAFKDLLSIPRTFVPTSLLGYSDNVGGTSKVLYLNEDGSSNSFLQETKRVVSEKHENRRLGKISIGDIKPSDILEMALLEHNVYGETLKQGMAEMQNMITAYLIKNALAERDGFMLKMMDENGLLLSYLIATERQYGDLKEIYISDFASKKQRSLLNSFITREFIERYKRQYENEDNFPVVTAEFREGTSYQFVENEKKLNNMLGHYGLQAKVVPHKTEIRGGETFHHCSIYILRKGEDVSKFNEMIKAHKPRGDNDSDKNEHIMNQIWKKMKGILYKLFNTRY